MRLLRRTILASLFAAISVCAGAQGFTTINATVTDSDSQAWANCTYSILYQPIPNYPGPMVNSATGQTISPNPVTGSCNSSGQISVGLVQSGFVFSQAYNAGPSPGVQITVCPNIVGASCYTTATIQVGAGPTQSVTTQINAVIQPPRLPGLVRYGQAYNDTEVAAVAGNQYTRISDGTQRCYTSSWAQCGSSPIGGPFLPLAGGSNGIMTGATGGAPIAGGINATQLEVNGAPTINEINVVSVDAYPSGFGSNQGFYNSGTTYPPCTLINSGGALYLSASASTGSTPSNTSAVWAFISSTSITGFNPRLADCAFAVATAYTQSTGLSSVLKFGSAGIYTKCAPWELSATGLGTVSLEGTYFDVNHARYTTLTQYSGGGCGAIAEPMVVHYPDPSHSSNVNLFIRNIGFFNSGLTNGVLEIDGAIMPELTNVFIRDVESADYPSLKVGSSALTGGLVTDPRFYGEVDIASYPGSETSVTPANVTVTQSGGTVTGYTVVSGGSYSSITGVSVLFTGYAPSSSAPCTTMPSQPTLTFTGSGPYVLSSIATGATPGSGCASTLYAQVVPNAVQSSLVTFDNASDGHLSGDLNIGGDSTACGLKINNHGGNVFSGKVHIVGGNGNVIPIGICDTNGGATFDNYVCDTINQLCFSSTGTHGPDTFFNETKYWNSAGAPQPGAGNLIVGSGASVQIYNGICSSTGLQSNGGYQEYMTPTGPVGVATPLTQVATVNNLHCDGSATTDNNLLGPLYVAGQLVGIAQNPVVASAGGDLACAEAADITIGSNAITAGSATTLTGTTLPAAFYPAGTLIGVTGASPGGLNGGPYATATTITSGSVLTFAGAVLPATWTSGGTIYLWCGNQSTDAASFGNRYVFANGLTSPTVPYSFKSLVSQWASSAAPVLNLALQKGSTSLWVAKTSITPINSYTGLPGAFTWDFNAISSTLAYADLSAFVFGTSTTIPNLIGSVMQPTAISSSSQLITPSVYWAATGVAAISVPSIAGCTVTGTSGQTVLLTAFNDSSTATATVLLNNTVSGAALSSSNVGSITITSRGQSATTAPTSATCSAGTASSATGTATFTSTLGGAAGNALLQRYAVSRSY